MKGVPAEQRQAVFRCVIAYAYDDQVEYFEGSVDGVISEEPVGESGFGYDPVFYVPKYEKTFAELPLERKNEISHRGLAIDAWIESIQRRDR